MAINKTINKSTKSHGAMRNCIEYVLREDKTNRGLVYVTGPFSVDEITYDSVYQSFLEEKKLWGKDSGRMLFLGIKRKTLHYSRHLHLEKNL